MTGIGHLEAVALTAASTVSALGRSGPELSPQLKVTTMEPSRTRARQLLNNFAAYPEAALLAFVYVASLTMASVLIAVLVR